MLPGFALLPILEQSPFSIIPGTFTTGNLLKIKEAPEQIPILHIISRD
jgi:hypothetical protein